MSKESLIRWGCRGKDGIFLDIAELPDGTWYTSREALKRYLEAKQKHKDAQSGKAVEK